MKRKITPLALLFILLIQHAFTQNNSKNMTESALPYKEIPAYPKEHNPGNILSRFVDGLGYRYHWATEGLTQKDLDYKPSDGARSTFQTVEHIYDLSATILNAAHNKPNTGKSDTTEAIFKSIRAQTLSNLKKASETYANKSADELAQLKVIFGSGDKKREFPLWNMMNGPISDALYHTGQIVSFRRSSGNPISPKVSVFMGKNKE